MGAVTPKFQFGFKLKEGPTNVRNFKENSTTQTFHKDSLVKLSTAGLLSDILTELTTGATASHETGFIGVAQKDHTGVANSLIPVYVISPEQVWEVHAAPSKKPNTGTLYDEGDAVKLAYAAKTAYTLSNGTTSMTTDVGAWYAAHAAASAAGKGAVVIGYRRGEEGRKGGRMLIKFSLYACADRY